MTTYAEPDDPRIIELVNLCEEGSAAEIEQMLAAGVDVNGQYYWMLPLTTAAESGNLDAVRVLLAAGAEVDAVDGNGTTALMRGARWGNLAVVQALLDAGADVNFQDDEDGSTLLMFAAATSDPEVVRTLLAAGAGVNVNAKGFWGRTALFDALSPARPESSGSRLPVVQALLAAGADVNVQHQDGATPLMLAAENGDPAVVAALLAAGADKTVKDNEGYDALAYARAPRRLDYSLPLGGITGRKLSEVREEDRERVIRLLESADAG